MPTFISAGPNSPFTNSLAQNNGLNYATGGTTNNTGSTTYITVTQGCAITPRGSGRCLVFVQAIIFNNSLNLDTATLAIYLNTDGYPPINVAPTGVFQLAKAYPNLVPNPNAPRTAICFFAVSGANPLGQTLYWSLAAKVNGTGSCDTESASVWAFEI